MPRTNIHRWTSIIMALHFFNLLRHITKGLLPFPADTRISCFKLIFESLGSSCLRQRIRTNFRQDRNLIFFSAISIVGWGCQYPPPPPPIGTRFYTFKMILMSFFWHLFKLVLLLRIYIAHLDNKLIQRIRSWSNAPHKRGENNRKTSITLYNSEAPHSSRV